VSRFTYRSALPWAFRFIPLLRSATDKELAFCARRIRRQAVHVKEILCIKWPAGEGAIQNFLLREAAVCLDKSLTL
jgi:hypothetical protein